IACGTGLRPGSMLLPLRHRAAQHARRLRLSGGVSYDAGPGESGSKVSGSMLTRGIGEGSKWLLDKIVAAMAATGINPNLLTFLGLVVNFIAAAFFAVGRFFTGALIIFFAGFLDILDGQVARRQNRVTAFGAFYDSTLDRYADMALYMGLLVYYSVSGRTPYVVLAAVATAGLRIVSVAPRPAPPPPS